MIIWYTVDIRYLEYPLSRTFIISSFFLALLVALSVTSLINSVGISNPAIFKLFSRSLQRFLGCFPYAISNVFISLIRMLK